MKKIFALLLTIATLFTLSSCMPQKELDYRSILDTETGKIYSLGDSKQTFDDAFGKPELHRFENYDSYYYLGDILGVKYYNGKAYEIICFSKSTRFEFESFNFKMDVRDVVGRYTPSKDTTSVYEFYKKYYNDNGDVVNDYSDAAVLASLATTGSDGEYVAHIITDVEISAKDAEERPAETVKEPAKMFPISVLDTETNKFYHIGNSRETFLKGLGEPFSSEPDRDYFADLTVDYSEGIAYKFTLFDDNERFEFNNFSLGMDIEDIIDTYVKFRDIDDGDSSYYIIYDEEFNRVELDSSDATYCELLKIESDGSWMRSIADIDIDFMINYSE